MAGDDYVLSHTADAFERERLGHMESLVDLPTHRYLATLGIRQGWRCLEIGAGHGAVARWLAEQVGPQGRVVATDVDTRLLTDLTLPNVEVRQHDIRTDPLESGTYDLAHCRTLLMHMLNHTLWSGAWWQRYGSVGGSWSRSRIFLRFERLMPSIRLLSSSIARIERSPSA
jgi:SAM-dependent methyltransferase